MKRAVIILTVMVLAFVVGFSYAYARPADVSNRDTVYPFDLERYLGKWYEIARYDHSFERGLDCVTATYTMDREKNRVEVLNSGIDSKSGKLREAVGKAKTTKQPGLLRVSFFWFFYSDYRVMELGENYDWVVVGSSSPKYLWILSRTPSLPQPTLEHILSLIRQRGYDTAKLIYPKSIECSQ